MKHLENNHYFIMFLIMLLSGLLSTMNVWVDKIDDIRFSMNDGYMIFLMSGWMLLFMGLIYTNVNVFFIGGLLVIVNIFLIRTQLFVTENQYKLGMIPHHSMAIHMSKQLLKKQNNIPDFLNNIITTQENEILYLKNA
jgi:hypothetical protein